MSELLGAPPPRAESRGRGDESSSSALEVERPTIKPAAAPVEGPRRRRKPRESRKPRRRPLPPALVLALRVALTLAALAVPAIFLQHSSRRRDPLVAALVTLEATAALVPLTMWTPLVGSVCLQAAYVLPAVAAGGGLATAAWQLFGRESRTALAATAGALAAGAAAWGAATPGMSQVGGVAAAVAVVVAFLGFNFERPVAPHLALAVSLAGLAGGSLAFLLATWAVAPRWASDACLGRAGEALDALVRMVGAGGGGGWRLGGEEEEEKREQGGGKGSSRGREEEEEGDVSTSPSTFLGAIGEPSTPRIPPRLKRLFQKKKSSGRRKAAAAEAKGTTTATATTTATTETNTDEEAPPPLPPNPTPAETGPSRRHHRAAPAPGYNRPAPLAGGESLSGADRAWVELSSALDAAEALLAPAAGEAFWGHVSLPRLSPSRRRRSRVRVRVLTPALPPPLWPLRLRALSGAHVVPLRAAVGELAAALRASARLCWTMRSLSTSSAPLSPGGPVSTVARKVYFVPWREGAGAGGAGARAGAGAGAGGEEEAGGKTRDLLAEWQAALEAAAAAAARAVPRSFSSSLAASSSDESDDSDDSEEEAVAGAGDSSSSSSPSLASALARLRRAAEALDLARERAGAGAGAATVALLLSRAAEDEKGESFSEEARFGAWEGGVPHAVENAERVGRAVEALRGMMPK